MAEQDNVLLVDEGDRPLGLMAKLPAHEQGVLHRAFSAYVFQRRGAEAFLLLQKRARTKYHFGGLWTNTCCGHPLEGETPVQAGLRRIPQEMNFTCELRAIGTFIYRAESENGLIEHELDHVLVGTFDREPPAPNPNEADDARWISVSQLERELAAEPDKFTPWFAKGFAVVKTKEPTLLG
jgi:isopentenyl-diphosphate delta-isomerase